MARKEVRDMLNQEAPAVNSQSPVENLVTQRCAYCEGTGEVDVGEIVPVYEPCPVCEGYGQVRVSSEHVRCPQCKGTGIEDVGECIEWFMPCKKCHGTGWPPPPPMYA
jgi:DnaJ-class molecular chaperone